MVRTNSCNDFKIKIEDLPSTEQIIQRINDRYDKLFHTRNDGVKVPYVCAVCDKLLISSEDNCFVSTRKMKSFKDCISWNNVADIARKEAIQQYYTFDASSWGGNVNLEFLEGMALSPRSVLYKKKQSGFACCKHCYHNICRKTIPRHSIVNFNYCGGAPKCLTDLNEVELAFITPIKHYGCYFNWQGGKQMKGSLSFMSVDKEKVAQASAQFQAMGLNSNIVVLYDGKMSKQQFDKAKARSKIRVEKIGDAVKWLIENNRRWSDMNYDEIMSQYEARYPEYIEQQHIGEQQNIEVEEVFTCYYPDGVTSTNNGGFSSAAEFKEHVKKMEDQGYKLIVQSNIEKKYYSGGDHELLVDANLIQFPYGVGGLNERRKLHDGSWSRNADPDEFYHHLSLKSEPSFQKGLFTLMLYSMISKRRLMTSAYLKTRGKTSVEELGSNFNSKDVVAAIQGRRNGNRHAGTEASRTLLDVVDATSKFLPHTDDAAKQARRQAESMQHHFGMASVFLTVTFDDENSILMQVISGRDIDLTEFSTAELTEKEMSDRVKERRALRLELPGIAALNFEIQFQILMEEVVGWDMTNNKPLGVVGYFGIPYALHGAIEEQGRKTLHTHMLIWIEGYHELQEAILSGDEARKEDARKIMQNYNEHFSSTELFPNTTRGKKKAFDHDCTATQNRRKNPDVVNDQQLCALRHRKGYKETNGLFATCPDCGKTWTYEQMITSYLKSKGVATKRDTQDDKVLPRAEMYCNIIEYQKGHEIDPPKDCINAAYQAHKSDHVDGSCFRCQKKGNAFKRRHKCNKHCECRFHQPDVKRRRCTIFYEERRIPWYLWEGTETEKEIGQVLPK